MSLNFEIRNNNLNQIVAGIQSTGGTMTSGKLMALIGGGVLQELDAQIDMYKTDLQAANQRKSAIRSDIGKINELLAQTTERVDHDRDSTTETQEMIQLDGSDSRRALHGLSQELGFDDDFYKKSNSTENSRGEWRFSHNKVTVKFLEAIKERLEDQLNDLNSQSEMDQIQFQALMDARKQNVMMLSNIMNSDHQTKMSIINNLK